MKPKTLLVGGLALFLGFTFLPIGINNGDVIDGYYATTSYASAISRSQSALVSPYITMSEAKLEDIDSGIAKSADTLIAAGHLMCLADGTPLDVIPSSSFPRRGRTYSQSSTISPSDIDYSDNVSGPGAWHRGCDLQPISRAHRTEPVYLCSYFDGEVVDVTYDVSYGWNVTVQHSEFIFTHYCHMAYGYGASEDYGATDPNKLGAYQRGFTPIGTAKAGKFDVIQGPSSILVKVGDHVTAGQALGILGSTGSSTGPHGHIELMVCPNGYAKRWNTGGMFYASVVDHLYNHKKMSELMWYQHKKGIVNLGSDVFEDFDETGGDGF